MDRTTVLQARPRDLRALPLSAREGYFASQFDGRLTLEEVAELAGFDLPEASALADRLFEAGAVLRVESTQIAPRRAKAKGAVEEQTRRARVDPRSEADSPRPTRRRSVSLEATKRSVRPAGQPTAPSDRGRSRRSVPVARPALGAVDPATLEKLGALETLLGEADHYALLDVARDAKKKEIKRAYFGLAATFHPDRYYGKNIGAVRPRIERVFQALTEAHDTLSDVDARAAYDARLPKAEKKRATVAPRRPSKASLRPPRSLVPKASAAPKISIAPKRRTIAPKAKTDAGPETVTESSRTLIGVAPPPRSVPQPDSGLGSPPSSGRGRADQLRAAMGAARTQQNVDRLVKAAEDALRADDYVGAANSYRLALAHTDDPVLRIKFEDVDAKARIVRFEKNIGPAQQAERDGRWSDAAVFLLRAYDARPDPDVAARAARAIRGDLGDLEKAAKLAEEAVNAEPRNVGYLAILGDVFVAANRLGRAEEICREMRKLAPKDARVDALTEAISVKSRGQTKVY